MKKRIISGVIGIAFVILALVFRNTIAFNIIIALALVIAMVESQVTTKLVTNSNLVLISCVYAAVSPFFALFGFFPSGLFITALYVAAVMLITLSSNKSLPVYQPFYSVAITLLVTGGINSLLYLNNLSVTKSYMYTSNDCLFFLLFAFAGAWLADTGAYFIGSKFGRHKISPNISPKKSLEGLVGGVIFTVVGMLILGLIWNGAILESSAHIQFGYLVLISAICPLVGLVGDLFFSYIKRGCNMKDFGKIMPGHGGILDRVDSLVLVAPFIYLMLMYMPIIAR